MEWITNPNDYIGIMCETHCPTFEPGYVPPCSFCNVDFSGGDDDHCAIRICFIN